MSIQKEIAYQQHLIEFSKKSEENRYLLPFVKALQLLEEGHFFDSGGKYGEKMVASISCLSGLSA